MPDRDWEYGDIMWTIVGAVVIVGLVLLNAYFQKLARIEEERRIGLQGSDPLNRPRSVAFQSRRSDDN